MKTRPTKLSQREAMSRFQGYGQGPFESHRIRRAAIGLTTEPRLHGYPPGFCGRPQISSNSRLAATWVLTNYMGSKSKGFLSRCSLIKEKHYCTPGKNN